MRDAGPEHESAIDLLAAKYAQYRDVRPTGAVLEITAVAVARMVGGADRSGYRGGAPATRRR